MKILLLLSRIALGSIGCLAATGGARCNPSAGAAAAAAGPPTPRVVSAMGMRAPADDERFLELLRANSYELRVSNGRLSGSGAEFLMQACEDSQFFAFGEPHNMKEVPEICTLLFAALQEHHGYQHFALEACDVATQMVENGGDVEAIFDFARKYPNALAFCSDQELRMLGDIGRLSQAETGKIWGLDQAFGALHILDRLLELAPNDKSRRATEVLLETAREQDGHRVKDHSATHFMGQVAEPSMFTALRDAYPPKTERETEHLLDALETSKRIYHNMALYQREARPTAYSSALEREKRMKTLFLAALRRAERSERHPSVLLKLGHVHLSRGRNPNEVYSLGNLISELAISNGKKSFHLNAAAINRPGHYWSLTDYPSYSPLASVGDPDRWIVVDLRPLRGYVGASEVDGLGEAFRTMIFAWDAALLIGGASPATFEIVPR